MKIDIRLPFITIVKTDNLADMRRDIQFWSSVFGRFSKQECLHCGKELAISPIGSGYYIEKDGVVHMHCMNEYLERRKKQ